MAAIAETIEFITTVFDATKILFDENFKAKPIAANFRHSNKEDMKVMQNEILDLLQKEIVRYSTSPWPTFAVNGSK